MQDPPTAMQRIHLIDKSYGNHTIDFNNVTLQLNSPEQRKENSSLDANQYLQKMIDLVQPQAIRTINH